MTTAPPLEARHLHKRFGARSAVEDLSLTVEEGLIYGFLGPNGAGKTTTIRMLLGLIAPSGGRVRIFGHDVHRDFKRAIRQVGAMVEGPAFYPFLSARRNLKLFGRLSGGVSRARIEQVLEEVGLLARADQKVGGYSQGMRQRLGIALALLEQPRLLVLDEPTNGLDPQGTREVRELIGAVRARGRTTVFLSSHLLSEMERICDRVAILARGRVLREGGLEDLLGGERAVVEIEVEAGYEGAARAQLAERWGARARDLGGGRLAVEGGGADAPVLNRALVEAGIPVRGLRARHRSLEEVFVALTGEASDIA